METKTINLTPEATGLAEEILVAAGSGLRHYTQYSRERILIAAQKAIDRMKARGE